jgi:three-Cys-motif partner protein
MGSDLKIDEIGYWSEIKLSILEKYAKPYNQILNRNRLKTIYIDAFAGAGHHLAKGTMRVIQGSPLRALTVEPPFDQLHLIDIDSARVQELKRIAGNRTNVLVHLGDCNKVLLQDVFPTISFGNYQRALCILDPYGLHLDWKVIKAAGDSGVIEIFLNFPVMDMNMNVFWANPDVVSKESQMRMTRFWGDESWREAAYQSVPGLFGEMREKSSIDHVVASFQERLKKVAGFKHVPRPMPMRNSKGAIVYFLFFAAINPTAGKIVKEIFESYETRGAVSNG